MEVGREPVRRLESVQNVSGRRGAEPSLLNIVSEMFLEPEQSLQVAVIVDLPGPVMTEHDVGRVVLQLLQPDHLQVPDVVSRPAAVVVIWWPLIVTHQIVSTLGGENRVEIKAELNNYLEYSRQSSYPHTVDLQDAGVPHVVNIGRHPASIGELLQVVGGLVVPSNEDGEDRCDGLPAVVFVEAAHGLVLVRAGHAREVGQVAGGLEVSAAQQEVDFDTISVLWRSVDNVRTRTLILLDCYQFV